MAMTALSGLVERLINLGRKLCARDTVVIDGVPYRVREKIAEGGFSIIELVQHPRTRNEYALKRITCHSIEDQRAAMNEIDFHRRLGGHDKGILWLEGSQVFGDADIVHNRTSEVLLLLPYIKHGTLHHQLEKREKNHDPYDERQVIELFLQICRGLRHFHEAALAHRDLKPHNVLLEEESTPMIMDLGSVQAARLSITNHSEAQRLQDVAAEQSSITYRPPELFQVSSKCDIDERTDIWSLGCLLYAMCYYKSPYDLVWERGDSVALAVQSGSAHLTFPKVSKFNPDLHELIAYMLNPDLPKRPFLDEVMERAAVLLEVCEEKV